MVKQDGEGSGDTSVSAPLLTGSMSDAEQILPSLSLKSLD